VVDGLRSFLIEKKATMVRIMASVRDRCTALPNTVTSSLVIASTETGIDAYSLNVNHWIPPLIIPLMIPPMAAPCTNFEFII
jgi:hypothetical protein